MIVSLMERGVAGSDPSMRGRSAVVLEVLLRGVLVDADAIPLSYFFNCGDPE